MSDFTLIAIEGAFGTSVAATLDLLRTARSLAPVVGAPAPASRVCSAAGGIVHLQSGLSIETSALEPGHDTSTWILPGLALTNEDDILGARQRHDIQHLVEALAAHVARGGRIAAGCSSVFLLEFAGLLDCKRVTTTWWLAPLLQRMNPRCRVDAARMVCADGQIVTAGAAFAQADMMLHLLRDACGPALVDLLSRHLLVDSRDAQSPYVVPELLANGDELVTRIVARVERALPEMPTVAALAASFRMSERTLSRHVRKATGQSTMALLQSIRLRKARALLAQSRMSVEQVASAVGYGDATALRRLMRKIAGTTPRQYRPCAAAPD